jgi:hypothetical protein
MAQVADGILWIHESTLVKLADIPRSTYQTWDAELLVRRPASGAFSRLQVVEAIVCRAARAQLSLNATRNAMDRVRDDSVLGGVVDLVRDPRKVAFVDLVVNKDDSDFKLCFSEREVLEAVRNPQGPCSCVVTILGRVFADAMKAFDNEASRGRPPSIRKRGRPPKEKSASVIPLRGG